ncbi:MAG: helix-turn-helix domain-containing protein [Victivallales bacterium]|nr:helix-turn-helix domain-containing protein [Victivallales bacterium]
MKQQTSDLIASLLQSDETVTPEIRDYILRAMRQATPKRKLITAKGAMEVLGVSRPTLREYVKRGVLEQINISSRKVRFDEEEVSRLAYNGI